jgi:hypothetical protein
MSVAGANPTQDHVILTVPAPDHNAVHHTPSMTPTPAEPSPHQVSQPGR